MATFSRLFIIVIFLPLYSCFAERRLNSVVYDLINTKVDSSAEISASNPPVKIFEFSLKRDNWVYIKARPEKTDKKSSLHIGIDSNNPSKAHYVCDANQQEFMFFASKGQHRISLWPSQWSGQLIVRRIPELIYYEYEYCQAMIGKYRRLNSDFVILRSWDDLKRLGVLKTFNVMTARNTVNRGSGDIENDYQQYIRQWKTQGRKWLTDANICWNLEGDRPRYEYWKQFVSRPEIDGIILDEFIATEGEKIRMYPDIVSAINMIAGDAGCKGKVYAFTASWRNGYDILVNGILAKGHYICPEFYFNEQATKAQAWSHLDAYFTKKVEEYKRLVPGVENNMIVFLGLCNVAPRYSWDRYPEVNYKTYLDMQLNLAANNDAFKDVFGFGFWIAHYADDELIKWFTKLVRHYFIDGSTAMLSIWPYENTHIINGGFESGLEGWQTSSSGDSRVAVCNSEELSFVKHLDYPSVPEHEKMLIMEKTPNGCNKISQKIKNLVPGTLYKLSFYVADFNDWDIRRNIDISVDIPNVEIVQQVHTDYIYDGRYKSKKTNEDVQVCWNYYSVVFMADAESAELSISDQPEGNGCVSGIAQKLMCDFVQVEPYYYGDN